MPDPLDTAARIVARKLRTDRPWPPTSTVIRRVLQVAFWASLKTEEGRYLRTSITFANPSRPMPHPPLLLRAAYPGFTPLGAPLPLTPASLCKFSRGVDAWAGSIAIYGRDPHQLQIWGIVDQLVGQSVRLNREGESGGSNPGQFTVSVEGPGDLTVYHRDLLLCRLRQDRVTENESSALESPLVVAKVGPSFEPFVKPMTALVGPRSGRRGFDSSLMREWAKTVARVCIGLRRHGTGGALLITPNPRLDILDQHYVLPYGRLERALVLGVLDSRYRDQKHAELHTDSPAASRLSVLDASLAEADHEDRQSELAGAIRLLASLAAVDGLALLSPTLRVHSFGTKVRSGSGLGRVYSGLEFESDATSAPCVDLSGFGTRHLSVLRYCLADRDAVGVVVSQDGTVRVATSAGPHLIMWEDVKLQDYRSDAEQYIRVELDIHRRRGRPRSATMYGYSPMPKSLEALLATPPKANTLRRRR